ncbi:ATP-binding cassette domain-containing protein [bacterium]|nr:ATP-binding cassette domain-containing protein [bacterium]MBU1072582.1 ATP-binding cassette domain-containing protein [bacterium]MBU1675662.1 ATP-binding cassette domain-containing protein [bacterium]
MKPLIRVSGLCRDYDITKRREGVWGGVVDLVRPRRDTLRAVNEVSFDIEPGEMVGYIGANGAGKSTTIKMLTGILTPTSGEVRVGGLVPYRDRRHYTRHIGAVFGQRTQLWWDLAVVESFRLLKKIYEVPDADYKQQLGMLRELLALDDFMHQPVRKLSLGQRMRCDLAAALLHSPRLLFLDEPTIGLDVVAKESVRSFLRDVRERLGTTILLTTHDLGDIQQLCRRVIIIDHGIVVFDGELESLRSSVEDRVQLHVELRESATSADLAADTGNLPVTWGEARGLVHTVEFSRRAVRAAEVIKTLVNIRPVLDLRLEEQSIEEIVREIYRRGGREVVPRER